MVALISLVIFPWNHPFKLATSSLLVAENLLDLLLLLAAIDLSLFILFSPTAIVNVWVTANVFSFFSPFGRNPEKANTPPQWFSLPGFFFFFFITCGVDEEACRLVLFALKHRHARHKHDQGHVLDDLPRDGPASLVVPRHPVAVQRRGILRRQGSSWVPHLTASG